MKISKEQFMLAVYEGNEDQVADEIDFALKMLNEWL